MKIAAPEGGFQDAARNAAHAFRAVMTAMARPGDIVAVTGARPPAPLSVAAGAVVLTLCDADTPLWLAPSLDNALIRGWVAFHTGAPVVGAQQAMFGLGGWREMPLADFPIGTPEYPDRSATLIVEVATLENAGATLRGPGIRDSTTLSLPDTAAMQQNARQFPLGLDFILTCGDRLAGLPRSTRIG